MTDLDGTLMPPEATIKLSGGNFIVLERLRTRQFFKLLKIVTSGAGPYLMQYRLDPNDDTEVFVARLLALVLIAVPDAEDEAIEFLRSMCKPSGLIEGRRLNDADKERNAALWADLDRVMINPEIEDTVSILEAIVTNEAPNVQSLGKRLKAMFEVAQKTGQFRPSTPSASSQNVSLPEPDSTPVASSEDSPQPSTSSAPSTDGTTSDSLISASSG